MRFSRILQTNPNDKIATLLRVALAVVLFPHGAQKVLGWFGGHGFAASMGSFTHGMHIPAFFAFCAIMAEFAGALGAFTGFLTRIATFGIFVEMLVAVFLVHAPNGFFMNWFGGQRGEGFEYHILVLAISLALMIRGGGAVSVDGVLSRSSAPAGEREFRAAA